MTTQSKWPLEEVKEGDRVVCPHKPAWGDGVVLKSAAMGTFQLKTKKEILTLVSHKNSHGQYASVRFSDGRTRTVITSATPLKVVSPVVTKPGRAKK
jgi:hypothetical protein